MTETPRDARESVIRLPEGVCAPQGKEIVRILGETAELIGPDANYRTVYIVAIRDVCPSSSEASRV